MARVEYDLTDRTLLHGAAGLASFKYRRFDITSAPRLLDAVSGAAFIPKLALQDGDYDNRSSQIGLRSKFGTGPVSHTLNLALDGMHQTQHLGRVSRTGFATHIYRPTLRDSSTAISAINVKRKVAERALTSIVVADTLSFADGMVQTSLGVRRQRIEANNYSGATGKLTSRYDRGATTPTDVSFISASSVCPCRYSRSSNLGASTPLARESPPMSSSTSDDYDLRRCRQIDEKRAALSPTAGTSFQRLHRSLLQHVPSAESR